MIQSDVYYDHIFKSVNYRENQARMFAKAMYYLLFSNMAGDFLEFGTFKGNSLISAFKIHERLINEWNIELNQYISNCYLNAMDFYGFDFFKGIPELKEKDRSFCLQDDFKKGNYVCSQEEYNNNLKKNNIPMKKVITIPGFFSETLTDKLKKEILLKKAALIHIDCDIYSSTKTALNWVTDYVQYGTLIMFDDWFCNRANPQLGEQKAFTEWRNENNIKSIDYGNYCIFGKSFILHPKKE